jgi:hypothetical protein
MFCTLTRKVTRKFYTFPVIATFISVLTVLVAITALAQVLRPSGVGRTPANPQQRNRFGAGPMDPIAPLFLPAVNYNSGGNEVSWVAVGEVNGDGKLDLLVTNECGIDCTQGTVSVLLGNGDGTFRGATSYASGGSIPLSVATADVNRDGKVDLVVVNCGPIGINTCGNTLDGVVGVLLGNGDGTFQPVVTYDSGGGSTWSVAVADVNGDGKSDLLVANQCGTSNSCAPGSVGVLLGNGDGTFQAAKIYKGADYILWVATADVNGDGNPDLLVAGNDTVSVLLGNGDGSFQSAMSYHEPGGNGSNAVAAADVNGDGKPDLLVANTCKDIHCTNSSIGVLLGNGDGTFQSALSYSAGGFGARSIAIVDVNGDGKSDLLTANYSSNTVGLLLGNGDGTFRSPETYYSGGHVAQSLVVADVNGDGQPDIVVANLCGFQNCNPDLHGAASVLLHVGTKPTTTAIVSSLNPSVFGQMVKFTAAVSATSGMPAGTVAFFDGSASLGSAPLTSGSASVSVSTLIAASHSITAVYQGSLEYKSSLSAPLSQAVHLATTITSLTSTHNPALINQAVGYIATITSQYGGTVTGKVIFQDGGSTIATVRVSSGKARFQTKYTAAAVHAITATYLGDANNIGSASATLTEQIVAATLTAVTTSVSPSFIGQPVTFTASVTSAFGAVPDGELVAFYDGTMALASVALAGEMVAYTTSALSHKTHTIKVTYAGDANFAPSSAIVTQVVNLYPTTTALSSSPNPSQLGQAVTFTAQVTSTGPSAPTGKVQFLDGTTTLGTITLSGRVAKLTKSTLAVGTHSITAQYLGDFADAKSTSSVVQQTVQ